MLPKPRILLVGPWPPTTGGTTTFMLNVANSNLAEQYEILRHTTSRPPKKNVVDNYGYASVFRGGIARLITGGFITLWHLVSFPFVLVFWAPGAVQVQASDFQAFWEAALYVLMCRLFGRPVLLRLGGAFDHFYEVSSPAARRMIRASIATPDILIVQSNHWRDFVARLGRVEHVVVLPNSVADTLIDDRARQNAVAICLFAAGTEATRKGIDEVFIAMHVLKKRGLPVRFHLVAMPEQLQERLKNEGLSDLAEIDGYVSRERMIAFMRAADIFLMPSRGEGFPNALVEAMAAGMACVVTPVGSVPEIVGEDGAIVVPLRDGDALAKAITRLVQNPDDLRIFGGCARAIVSARYVQSKVLPILDGAWRGLLK